MINLEYEIKALEHDKDRLYNEFNKHHINEDDLQYNVELIDNQLTLLYDELYKLRENLK